jgi:hypothetical protein
LFVLHRLDRGSSGTDTYFSESICSCCRCRIQVRSLVRRSFEMYPHQDYDAHTTHTRTRTSLYTRSSVLKSIHLFIHTRPRYYPLPARKHSTFFGLVEVPRVSERGRHVLLILFIVSAVSGCCLHRWWFGITAFLSVLYFAQARTHGLVHNKVGCISPPYPPASFWSHFHAF